MICNCGIAMEIVDERTELIINPLSREVKSETYVIWQCTECDHEVWKKRGESDGGD